MESLDKLPISIYSQTSCPDRCVSYCSSLFASGFVALSLSSLSNVKRDINFREGANNGE